MLVREGAEGSWDVAAGRVGAIHRFTRQEAPGRGERYALEVDYIWVCNLLFYLCLVILIVVASEVLFVFRSETAPCRLLTACVFSVTPAASVRPAVAPGPPLPGLPPLPAGPAAVAGLDHSAVASTAESASAFLPAAIQSGSPPTASWEEQASGSRFSWGLSKRYSWYRTQSSVPARQTSPKPAPASPASSVDLHCPLSFCLVISSVVTDALRAGKTALRAISVFHTGRILKAARIDLHCEVLSCL